jgi:O-methyltransferase
MLFVSSFKRNFKNLFFRLRAHRVLAPVKGSLLKLHYLILQSEWIQKHKASGGHLASGRLNDFYSRGYRFGKMFELFDFVSESELKGKAIDYFEFGVFKGNSIAWWLENRKEPASNFYGFDTFNGLPEDFGEFKKGDLNAGNALPVIEDKRCRFYKGLFQQTLPGFLKTYNSRNMRVLHIDCDLYSSTLFVLASMAPFLSKGDLLIFDEFVTPTQEFKAFADFASAWYLKYELLGAVNNYHQTAIKIC